MWFGAKSLYDRAGFREVACRKESRPVVRRAVRPRPRRRWNEHHAAHGHADHAALFRDRFWWSLGLAVPVVLFSEMFQRLLDYSAPDFPGSTWISRPGDGHFRVRGLAVPDRGGGRASSPAAGHDAPFTAITVAFVASWATELGAVDLDFWWELSALIVVMLLGHWLEMRAVGQASSALDALASLLPDEAERVTSEGVETVPLDLLRTGDLVLVRPGGRVPADGQAVEGSAEVDESMITGSLGRSLGPPGPVAGTVATDSSIRVRITAVGEETALAGIRRLVEEAQRSRSRPRPWPTGRPPSCSTWPPGRPSSPTWCGRSSATRRLPWSTPSPSW